MIGHRFLCRYVHELSEVHNQTNYKMTNSPDVKVTKFGPNLVAVTFELVKEIANHCAAKNFSLASVSAFSTSSNDWIESMLLIYESLLTNDS